MLFPVLLSDIEIAIASNNEVYVEFKYCVTAVGGLSDRPLGKTANVGNIAFMIEEVCF